MPAPITLILKKKEGLPGYITNKKNTITIRFACSKVIEDLINRVGNPIFMTSANKSGERECSNLDEIEKNCSLLDGMMEGNVIFIKPTTIVDCTSEEIRILREGPISKEKFIEIL